MFFRQSIADLSIRAKLRLIVVGTCALVVLLVGSALTYTIAQKNEADVIKSVQNLNTLFGQQAVPWLIFRQTDVAAKALTTLYTYPLVKSAVILRADGVILAEYKRDDTVPVVHQKQKQELILNRTTLVTQKTIIDGEKELGTIIILSDLKPLRRDLMKNMLVFGLLLVISSVLALLLSVNLEKLITRPIGKISKVVREVIETKQYDKRVKSSGHDELGDLIDGFNAMLEQIESQTTELSRVNAATEDMVHDLWHAKVDAEKAHLAKTQFLARMSHEIRTPVNGVLGMVDLLMSSNLSTQQQRLAKIVRSSGQTLLHIINDLLDFAKIEAEKVELESVSYNLEEIADGIVEMLSQTAYGKGIDIGVYVDPRVPHALLGDPLRLRQVMINLLGNAVKFTSKGEVGLSISVEHLSEQEVLLRFEVRDTGIGIPQEAQKKIFEAFSQAEEHTTRRFGGTGLGLSIALQLVALMGGTISVVSTEGEGSSFSFSIRQPVDHTAKPPVKQASPELIALYARRLLLVEDSAIAQRSVLARLSKIGFLNVTGVTNATDAFREIGSFHVRRSPVELILLSGRLSDMDAVEFIKTLETQPEYKGVRVLLMASAEDLGRLETRLNLDVLPIAPKPIQTEPLQQALLKAFSDRTTPAEWLSPEPLRVHDAALPLTEKQPEYTNKKRILVAEDNPVNVEVACGMLRALGYAVDVAENGRIAVNAAMEKSYDLILMDGEMPEMGGLEATQCIRAEELRRAPEGTAPRHVPIIAATANIVKSYRDQYLAGGMNDFISKPFSREDLAAIIARWIDGAAPPVLAAPQPLPQAEAPQVMPAPVEAAAPTAAPPKEQGALPTVDKKAIATILSLSTGGGSDEGKEFLRSIVLIYFKDMEQSLNDLEKEIAAHNADGVRAIAHKMKSSCANVGALRLSQVARQLEAEPRASDLAQKSQQARQEFEQVRLELAQVIAA